MLPAARRPQSKRATLRTAPPAFMFATGIECSYPTIEHGRWRRDEMDSTRHYAMWQHDFELAREIGHHAHPLRSAAAPRSSTGRADTTGTIATRSCEELREHGPEPIVDLCHFGVPSWLGELPEPGHRRRRSPNMPAHSPSAIPWVRFYTPVNEMYVCARMSALDGLWNEQLRDEGAYARAAWNLANASIAMSDAILKRAADAIFINSESSEFYQPCCPDPHVQHSAAARTSAGSCRSTSSIAHPLSETMQRPALARRAFRQDDIDRLATARGAAPLDPRRRLLRVERAADRPPGQAAGARRAVRLVRDREPILGPLPAADDAHRDQQAGRRRARRAGCGGNGTTSSCCAKPGVPLVGFTWYSLTDQIDWSIAMSEPLGIVYPVGLFDLNREARTVGLAYKQLIDLYRDEPEYRECPALKEMHGLMATFLSAHGYDPGPSQRPLLAGAISGVLATDSGDPDPDRLRLARQSKPQILGLVAAADARRSAACVDGGCRRGLRPAVRPRRQQCARRMAVRHGVRLRAVGRRARCWCCRSSAAGGRRPGPAALGVALSLLVWGLATGILVPFVHRPLHESLEKASRHRASRAERRGRQERSRSASSAQRTSD